MLSSSMMPMKVNTRLNNAASKTGQNITRCKQSKRQTRIAFSDITACPGEAVAAGAGGLVHVRVAASGELDATRPVKEGLSAEQQAALLAGCSAQPVHQLDKAFCHMTLVESAQAPKFFLLGLTHMYSKLSDYFRADGEGQSGISPR